MNRLRGRGTTFSTSGQAWSPFRFNPKIARRNARLHRMMRAGTIAPMSKDELRAAAQDAAASHKPRTIPLGRTTTRKHD